MDQRKNLTIVAFGLAIVGLTGAATDFVQMREISELKKHPTYHCDGSTTMGYAVPGTPEAAACWIEGGK